MAFDSISGPELEIGSIGIHHGSGTTGYWAWGIDNAIPMREIDSQGMGRDRKDCMKRFRAGPLQRGS
jgi:hypothetical protein